MSKRTPEAPERAPLPIPPPLPPFEGESDYSIPAEGGTRRRRRPAQAAHPEAPMEERAKA